MKIIKQLFLSFAAFVALVVVLLGVVFLRQSHVAPRYDREAANYVDDLMEEIGANWGPEVLSRHLQIGALAAANQESLGRFIQQGRSLGDFKGNSIPRLQTSSLKLTPRGFVYRATYRTYCTFETGHAEVFLQLGRTDSGFQLLDMTVVPTDG